VSAERLPRVVAACAAGERSREQATAVAGQTAALAQTMAIEPSLEAACASGAELVWLLQGGAVPAPDALGRVLDVARGPLAPPIVAGLVLDAGGVPVDRLIPPGTQEDLEALIAGAAGRWMPIRHATETHVLLARRAVDEHGLPDRAALGPHAFSAWSRRVLREETGRLVPSSRATLPPGPDAGLATGVRDVPATLRMARTGLWTTGEKIRAFRALARS